MDKKHSEYIWIIACVSFAGFISTLDDYIVNVSLPTISRYFNASTSEAAQITLAYLLCLTGSLLLFGKLGDKIGYKKLFIIGFSVFTISSLLCGCAWNINSLVFFRCFQGLGAAMLSVMSPAIVGYYIPPEKKGWAFGILTTCCALGITLGAPLGGIISGIAHWRWIFLVNIPFGIAAVLVTNKALPAHEHTENKEKKNFRIDYIGAILSFSALFCLIYAFNMGEELGGWVSPYIITIFATSVICVVLFILYERRVKDPIMDLSIFRNLDFNFANLSTLFAYMLLAGCNFLLPFYLIVGMGLKPEKTGLIMLIYSVFYASISPFMGKYSDKASPRILCITGMFLAAGACVYFAFDLKALSLTVVIIYLIWRAVSYAMFISPNNKLVVSQTPADKLGVGSSILKVAVNLSLVLGVCLFETVFSIPLSEDLGSLHNHAVHSSTSINEMFAGFRYAYLFGAAVCILSAVFSILGSKIKPTRQA